MHLIVDSNYLFHRSRHALKDVSLSSEYIRTEIIYGVLKTLLSISKRFVIDEWSFVWDSKILWRDDEYPSYKAKRKAKRRQEAKEMTEEEAEIQKLQFQQLRDLRWDVIPGLGFKNNFQQTGAEGDDLIAKIIESHPEKEFLIFASDKDLYQLLFPSVSIFSGSGKVMDSKSLMKQYGVTAKQWGLGKAIGGCATDEVEGIKGCADPGKSEKSKALKYIKGELTGGVIFDRITSDEGKAIIERNKKLVILPHRNTGEVKLTPHSLYAKNFMKVFGELEFYSFTRATNFREWEDIFHLV